MSTDDPVMYDTKRSFKTLYYTLSNFAKPKVKPLHFPLGNSLQKL